MKNASLLVIFLLFFVSAGVCQVPNSWIQFDQTYYKIPVAQNGVYRLSYLSLQQAGFPVGSVDPRNIQLYHRGQEQSILVTGEDDGSFNVADYVEFYGVRNDGTLDKKLYKSPEHQPNPNYNLYSDTTSYFLTIGQTLGKRMLVVNEVNSGGLPAQAFHVEENLLVISNNYSIGRNINGEFSTSNFDEGEGWTGFQIGQGQQIDYTLTNIVRSVHTSSPTLQVSLVGRNNAAHTVEIYVGTTARLLTTVNFFGFAINNITQTLQWSDIAPDGTLLVRVRVAAGSFPDRVSTSSIRLQYPQEIDMASASSKAFTINTASAKAYLEIKNAPSGVRIFDITDRGNVRLLQGQSSTTYNVVVPTEGVARSLFATSAFISPSIKQMRFRPIDPLQHDYVIITHPRLRRPSGEYADPVKAYAEYRASEQGGRYDTLVVNIQELYNQFNYGEVSSLAIFKFVEYLSSIKPPKYMLIIGRGLEIWYAYYRNPSSATWFHQDLIPPSGYPSSDMLYAVGLSGNTYEPAIPTGRLTALQPDDVANYLNKVKEMELVGYDALWRKNILHLSGGIEDHEPEQFKGFMQEFQAIAEGPYLGASVSSIAKNSRDLKLINIAEQVNNGVNLVTFFGHSSSSTLDFDVGFVSNPVLGYNNKGKYPVLLMNGCEAGAFFIGSTLFGEDWIHAKDKGAIGFIAHTSFGQVGTLKEYTTTFYNVAYADSVFIKKGIGDIQKEVVRRYMEKNPPSITNLSQVQQMVLLGDPAVKLFGAKKPDLEVVESGLSIKSLDGKKITALSDSFAINIVVKNFGLATNEPFRIEVKRTLNDNSVMIYDSLFNVPAYADTLSFIIRKQNELGFGSNRFEVTLDPDEVIAELNEDNNTASMLYVIPFNQTKNLFPAEYAVTNSTTLTLSFQNTDVFATQRQYLLEVDTTRAFNSSLKKSFTLTGDVYIKKEFETLTRDSTVYFWRTRILEPGQFESSDWQLSSFTYIKDGNEGWGQLQFAQQLDNAAVGLVPDQAARAFKYQESINTIDVITYGANAGKTNRDVSVKIGGAEYNLYVMVGGAFGCRDNTLNLIAFDKSSASPYPGIYFKWYELLWGKGGRRLLCGREPFVINSFTINELVTGLQDDLIKYIDNVAEGDSVLAYNIGNIDVPSWSATARDKMKLIGVSSAQLNEIQTGAPFVIMGKKGGEPGTAKLFLSNESNPQQRQLQVNKTVTGRFSHGAIKSGWIGPADVWHTLKWKVAEVEEHDEFVIDVIGVTMKGEHEVLINGANKISDLSFIDPNTYPFLKLEMHTADEVSLTSPQLVHWIVEFEAAPEGLLIPIKHDAQIVLQEGKDFIDEYAFINIGSKPFKDSLTVEVSYFNTQKGDLQKRPMKIKNPTPEEITTFPITRATVGLVGQYDLKVFVNPRIEREQHYDNNIIQRNDYLIIERDNLSPVIDVTIDGRYVEFGDFVSPTPLINVNIWDENPYLKKKDTLGIHMFLQYPCEGAGPCTATYIPFSDTRVAWTPANEKGYFNIIFKPNLQDGRYTLLVEATDASDNKAGVEPYKLEFVVKNELTIELITPYPNPTPGSMHYGFRVSGSVVPSQVDLMVMDSRGMKVMEKVVKEDTLFIGKNIIPLDFNAQRQALPNGIYYFRLLVILDGKSYTARGKLVVVR